MRHDVKIERIPFRQHIDGIKHFELRYNDRDYEVGDELFLKEFHEGAFTGDFTIVVVTAVLHSDAARGALADGWCILSTRQLGDPARPLANSKGYHYRE